MKKIVSIGFRIPLEENSQEVEFINNLNSFISLSHADIIIFSPYYPFTHQTEYIKFINHWKLEFEHFLTSGKTLILICVDNERTSSAKLGYNSSYDILPQKVKESLILRKAIGDEFIVENAFFSNFFNDFKGFLSFENYLYPSEKEKEDVIFKTKDKRHILGKITYFEPKGILISLPKIQFLDEVLFQENSEKGEEWTENAISLGKNFIKSIVEIDKTLKKQHAKTPTPNWLENEQYLLKEAEATQAKIETNQNEIKKLEEENQLLQVELEEYESLKDLLFESGKPLEQAIIKALKILGYKAENYDDGSSEFDQIIISPEGYRYIGENEGKDKNAIDIKKFRQLNDNINEDFEREEVDKKAFGLLFGNTQRFLPPNERTLDFTDKCIRGAGRDKIGLIKTSDLFFICRYLLENDEEEFKKSCRLVIHNQLGKIIKFPEIPKL